MKFVVDFKVEKWFNIFILFIEYYHTGISIYHGYYNYIIYDFVKN